MEVVRSFPSVLTRCVLDTLEGSSKDASVTFELVTAAVKIVVMVISSHEPMRTQRAAAVLHDVEFLNDTGWPGNIFIYIAELERGDICT